MTKVILAVAIVILITGTVDLARAVEGEQAGPYHSMLTGNDYIRSPIEYRVMYIGGLFDGVGMAVTSIGADERALSAWNTCIKGMTVGQTEAIVSKHVMEHPEYQDSDMWVLSSVALLNACAARGYQIPFNGGASSGSVKHGKTPVYPIF